MRDWSADWLRAAFTPNANPSFSELLRSIDSGSARPAGPGAPLEVPHATTILGLRFADGIVMAGDRRATEGNLIADRRIEKVFPADEYSAVAIAGVAGQAIELVKLLQVELEHYEKYQGEDLSLEGKANRLAGMIRQNLPYAMQGLVVVPLYGGFDRRRGAGRLFRFDVIGGRYEELDFTATGSGGLHARASLKKAWRPGMSREEAVRAAIEALMDASEDDTATGGPDLMRNIYPTIATVTAAGYATVSDGEIRPVVESLLAERAQRSV